MSSKKLRKRIAGAATLTVVSMAAMLTLTTGVAEAGISVPAYPTVGIYPNWLTSGTTITVSSTITATSTDVTTTATTNFNGPPAVLAGYYVSGPNTTPSNSGGTGIPAGDTVASVNSGTDLTLATPATVSTTENLTFTIPGTETLSNVDRSSGSDTTLFMMQQIGDLYNQAGLYGCQLIGSGSGQNADCDNVSGTFPNYSNVSTSDSNDNWDRTETLMGINNIGSTNGQQQLCGTQPNGSVLGVDWARSSKPAGTISGCTMIELGYAKDSVPAVDFQSVDPEAVGSATYYDGTAFGGAGNPTNIAFPSGGIGPVAAGWLPGDPYNCVPSGEGLEGTPCSGTPFTDVDNTGGASSVAYRLWCATGSTRITDWGQLTNLAGGKTVGNGTPIGVPIRIIGINSGSGTVSTFASYANSGVSGGLCGTNPPVTDGNAASGQNPFTNDGLTNNLEIAVENNASEIGTFAASDFPNDPADQAVVLATSLYFESYGVNLSNPNAGQASLTPGTGTIPSGVPVSYTVSLMNEDEQSPTIANERTNTYPTARTLFNIYNASKIRASVGGFLNWICDSNSAIQKGTDLTSGQSFDGEITNIINDNFDYSRLNDNTTELAASKLTPADGVTAPNSTCDASLAVTGNGTDTVTMTSGSPVPSPQAFVTGQKVLDDTTGVVPASTTVQSVSGDTMTFNNAIATGATTVYFPGMAPVLSVTAPNT